MAHPIKLKDMQKKSNLIPVTEIGCSSKRTYRHFSRLITACLNLIKNAHFRNFVV